MRIIFVLKMLNRRRWLYLDYWNHSKILPTRSTSTWMMWSQGLAVLGCPFSEVGGRWAGSIPSKSFSARKTSHCFQMCLVTVMYFHKETRKSLRTGRVCIYSQPHAHRTQNTHSINLTKKVEPKQSNLKHNHLTQEVPAREASHQPPDWASAPRLRAANGARVRRGSCSHYAPFTENHTWADCRSQQPWDHCGTSLEKIAKGNLEKLCSSYGTHFGETVYYN